MERVCAVERGVPSCVDLCCVFVSRIVPPDKPINAESVSANRACEPLKIHRTWMWSKIQEGAWRAVDNRRKHGSTDRADDRIKQRVLLPRKIPMPPPMIAFSSALSFACWTVADRADTGVWLLQQLSMRRLK
jgi:hypothetical protein